MPGLTGIMCAVEKEAKPFTAAMMVKDTATHTGLTFREGLLENAPVIIVCCGVCKVNAAIAAQTLISQYPISRIIMSGTAGGIDRRLKIGDTVIATDMAYHDVAPGVLTELPPFLAEPFFQADKDLLSLAKQTFLTHPIGHTLHFGRIVTGETFITMAGRASIIERLRPLCVDMETAAVAHVCHVHDIPFLAVRTISDTEDEAGEGAFFRYADMASEHSFEVVKALLNSLGEIV